MAYPRAEVKTGQLSALLVFLFLGVFANLFWMQIVQGSYYSELSEKNRLRILYLESPRGKILDRRGRVMADSRLSFDCTVMPREAKNTLHESLQVLSPILGQKVESLEAAFKKKKAGAYRSVILSQDIEPEKAIALEEMLDTLPGMLVETRPQREYPYAEAAAHLLGYIGPINEQEKEALGDSGYHASDWVGREGVEKVYENYLQGIAGGIQMEVNSRGRFLRSLGTRQPKEGRALQLTVDAELQRYIQKLLSGKKASVITMDLSDGGILSMNSAPTFNPNLFASPGGRKEVGKYLKGPASPMINRGISGHYPPGSVFKMVTALAGFESGKLRLQSSYRCPGFLLVGGKRFGCWREGGHGDQGIREALAHSCDVFFYLAGIATRGEVIAEKALRFGFSQKTGIDLPAEKKGFVPTREWKRKRKNQGWYDGDTANLSIGQGYLQVTPLQALVMTAVIATGGDRLVPHVLDRIDGVKVSERIGVKVRISPEYLRAIREGMDACVHWETGTGRLAGIQGARVVGKTGTAQSGQSEDHAWFVGYAPKENPKIAMVVFVEHGGHGGVEAAGVAHEVWEYLKREKYL